MSRKYDCYWTKDIGRKHNRKNWLSGTLEYDTETTEICVSDESGKIIARRFGPELYQQFANGDIVKIGVIEVEPISPNDDDNSFQSASMSNRQRGAPNNNGSRKFKRVGAPRMDARKMPQQSLPDRGRDVQPRNPIAQNQIHSRQVAGWSHLYSPSNQEPAINGQNHRAHINISCNDSNEINGHANNRNKKRKFGQLQNNNGSGGPGVVNAEVTESKTTVEWSGSILDHIKIDESVPTGTGSTIYENASTQTLEEALKAPAKHADIPLFFREPNFLSFMSQLPYLIQTTAAKNDRKQTELETTVADSKQEAH